MINTTSRELSSYGQEVDSRSASAKVALEKLEGAVSTLVDRSLGPVLDHVDEINVHRYGCMIVHDGGRGISSGWFVLARNGRGEGAIWHKCGAPPVRESEVIEGLLDGCIMKRGPLFDSLRARLEELREDT